MSNRSYDLDSDLLVRVAELARTYAGKILTADDADDVAQQVAMQVMVRLERGRPVTDVANVGALVRRMVRCRAADERERTIRRRQREAAYVQAHRGDRRSWMAPDGEGDEVDLGALDACCDEALGKLPERCRRAFVLVQLEDATYNEAAAALQVSRSTICGYVVVARRELRQALETIGIRMPGRKGRRRAA